MTVLTFPAIPPSFLKSITLPDYATLIKEFEDGGQVRRSSQFIGTNTTLSLSYSLISHSQAATIINFWASAKATFTPFVLPSVIIQHPNNIKLGLASLDGTSLYRFADNLSIKTDYATLQRGLYSFDVSIVSVIS